MVTLGEGSSRSNSCTSDKRHFRARWSAYYLFSLCVPNQTKRKRRSRSIHSSNLRSAEDYYETYVPVAKLNLIRVFLAMATQRACAYTRAIFPWPMSRLGWLKLYTCGSPAESRSVSDPKFGATRKHCMDLSRLAGSGILRSTDF